MDIRKLDDRVSVSGQLAPDDIAGIAAEGFRVLICNRPDDEHGPGQPSFAEVAAAAEAAGMTAHHIPFSGGDGPSADQVEETARIMATEEGPFFFYCRSGARSTGLYGRVLTRG